MKYFISLIISLFIFLDKVELAIAVCPFGLVGSENCTSCANETNNTKIFYKWENETGTCIDSCESYERVIPYINACYYCINHTELYYKGDCVGECPETTIQDQTSGLCLECSWNNTYLYENTCVSDCPVTTSQINNTCVNCKTRNGTPYLYNGTCLDKCPESTILYDYFSNMCVDCTYIGVYDENGVCSKYCTATGLGTYNSECVTCWTEGQLNIYGGMCEGCPTYSIWDGNSTGTNICRSCKHLTPAQYYMRPNTNDTEIGGECVYNCGKLAADFQYNFCYSQWNNMTPISGCSSTTGIYELLNTQQVFCRCKTGYIGKNCQYTVSEVNSLDPNIFLAIDQFQTFLKSVQSQNFYLIGNPTFYNNFTIYTSYVMAFSLQSVYNQSSTLLSDLENFVSIYYNSAETYHFTSNDIPIFCSLYQVIFQLKYYQLYSVYRNFSEIADQNLNITDLTQSMQLYYETFCLKLDILAKYLFKLGSGNSNKINKLAGYYDSSGNNFTNLVITWFDANIYNFARYRKEEIISFEPYVVLSRNCSFDSYYSIIVDWFYTDMSFFYEYTAFRSRYYYFQIVNENYTAFDYQCTHTIYYPLRDNFIFNFSYPMSLYTNLSKVGIDPFDPNDEYFNNVCYKYPNETFAIMKRKDRISAHFLNVTLKCVQKAINSETYQYCTFGGFHNAADVNGPNPYIKCICSTVMSEMYNYVEVEYYNLDSLPYPVFQIWSCSVPNATLLFYNPAFLLLNVFIVLEVSLVIFHFIFLEYKFFINFKWIRRHDMDFLEYLLPKATDETKQLLGESEENVQDESEFKRGRLSKRRAVFVAAKKKTSQNSQRVTQIKNLDLYSKNLNISDFPKLSFAACINFDEKRTLLTYFIDFLYDYHFISISLIKFSYFIPGALRILNFFLYLVNHLFVVGIFFSTEETDIFGYKKDASSGLLLYGIASSVAVRIVHILISLLIITSYEMRISMNKILFHKYLAIKEFQNTLFDSYSYKLLLFLGINITLQVFNGIYVINYNNLYFENYYPYFAKVIFVYFFDFCVVSLMVPLVALLARTMVFKYRKTSWFKFYRIIEMWKNWQKYF